MKRTLILTLVLCLLIGVYCAYRIVQKNKEQAKADRLSKAAAAARGPTRPPLAETRKIAQTLTDHGIQLRNYAAELDPTAVDERWRITGVVFTSEAQVTPEIVKLLRELPDLISCSFYDTTLSDNQLEPLVNLDNVKELNLNYTRVTDEGMKFVARIPNLQALSLNGDKITNAGLVPLLRVKSLTSLGLYDTEVSDEGVITLAACKWLRQLDIQNTQVSAEVVGQLRLKLPGCAVMADPY